MSEEAKPKFTTPVGKPIIVYPNEDAERIGRHYSALHDMQTGHAYQKLGQKVSTKHITKKLPDGSVKVDIVEEHY